jgi:hypothetical protein
MRKKYKILIEKELYSLTQKQWDMFWDLRNAAKFDTVELGKSLDYVVENCRILGEIDGNFNY